MYREQYIYNVTNVFIYSDPLIERIALHVSHLTGSSNNDNNTVLISAIMRKSQFKGQNISILRGFLRLKSHHV